MRRNGARIRDLIVGFLTFFVLGAAGILLSREAGAVAVFWPANGVVVALVVIRGFRSLVPMSAGAIVANLMLQAAYGDPVLVSLAFALANAAEIMVASTVILRLGREGRLGSDVRRMSALLVGIGAGAVPAAIIGGGSLALVHGLPAIDAIVGWLTADIVSALIVTPPLVTACWPSGRAFLESLRTAGRAMAGDLAVLAALLLAAAGVVASSDLPMIAVFALPLLWSATRLGLFATAATAAVVGVCLTALVNVDLIRMVEAASLGDHIRHLQVSLVLIALPPLFVAAALDDARAANRLLAARERTLAFALDSTDVGLWDWNIATGEVWFSDRWLDIVGYAPGELANHVSTWKRLADPDDQEKVRGLLARHFEGRSAVYSCEQRLRHKDGHWVWVLDRGAVVERDGAGRPLRAVGTLADIRRSKDREAELYHRASRDPLTGVGNRIFIEETAAEWIAAGQTTFALLLIDLDNFKPVNDTYGHTAGDDVLRITAERIASCLRRGDIVARIGGDEFAALIDTGTPETLSLLASRLAIAIGTDIRRDGRTLKIGASIGYAAAPVDGTTYQDLFEVADDRLYVVKRGNGIVSRRPTGAERVAGAA